MCYGRFSSGRFHVIICFVILCSAVGSAQDNPPPRDPTGEALLRLAFTNIRGEIAAQLHDLKLEGALQSPVDGSTVGTFVAKVRGNDFSIDTVRGQTESHYRVLHGRGTFLSGTSRTTLQTYNTEGLGFDLLPSVGRWTQFLRSAASIGTSTVQSDGTARIHVDLRPGVQRRSNKHDEFDVTIDPQNGLIIAVEYVATLGPYSTDQLPVGNRYEQYRAIGELLVPTRVTHFIDGRPKLVFAISSVTTGNAFTDADFKNERN